MDSLPKTNRALHNALVEAGFEPQSPPITHQVGEGRGKSLGISYPSTGSLEVGEILLEGNECPWAEPPHRENWTLRSNPGAVALVTWHVRWHIQPYWPPKIPKRTKGPTNQPWCWAAPSWCWPDAIVGFVWSVRAENNVLEALRGFRTSTTAQEGDNRTRPLTIGKYYQPC